MSETELIDQLDQLWKAEGDALDLVALCHEAASALQQALAERDEANAFVAKLQGALAFWLPSVTPEIEAETGSRAGDDACLLAGFEGDVPSPAWIDTKLARLTAALSAETEACAASLKALRNDEIRLHMGELSAQEMRAVRAFIGWQAHAIRKRQGERS